MATYGRGQHITPSIQSVLSQDFQDFELIVVGDHCQDDTEQAIAAVASPRLSWDEPEITLRKPERAK